MYLSPTSVSFEHEPVWFLKERVVVAWRDADRDLHLGEPSPLNKDASLLLWLGFNEADGCAVAMLQLTITHYVKAKRKRFDVFLVPTDLQMVDEDIPILPITNIPVNMSHMFRNVQGSSKSRFLKLSFKKAVSSRCLMPVRKSARSIQGAAEHMMLLAKDFTESADRFDLYMSYSTYAHQALTRHFTLLRSSYTPPAFDLASSYNHNGGAFNAWNDYLDTKSARTASDALEHRHTHKRKRAKYHKDPRSSQAEDEAPPAYTRSCPQVQVPASDHAPSPPPTTHKSTTDIPTTPLHRPFSSLSSFSLDPLDTPLSLPPLPAPFSPRVAAILQRAPLDVHFCPLIATRADVRNTLHEAFVSWLFNMQKLHPYLHEDAGLFSMLVAYGLAVQRGDILRFPNIKARATSLVLKSHVMTGEKDEEARDWGVPAEKTVQRLVRWMCGHVLHADEELVGQLLLLTSKAFELQRLDEPSLLAVGRQGYLLQEARCVADFFVAYAHVLSRHLKM